MPKDGSGRAYDSEVAMADEQNKASDPCEEPLCGFRLVRCLLLETLLVMLAGLLILGFAWEAGFFKLGLILAVLVWLGLSPIIDIATLRHTRKH